jgi:hypothetical protein
VERCRGTWERYGLLFELSNVGMSGDWGTIDASTGVLMSLDRGTRTLPGPFRMDDRTLVGDGWKLTLAAGWVVRPGPRPADFQIVREGRQKSGEFANPITIRPNATHALQASFITAIG